MSHYRKTTHGSIDQFLHDMPESTEPTEPNHPTRKDEQWPALLVLGGAGAAIATVYYDSHIYLRLLLLLTFVRAIHNRLVSSNYRFLRGAPWAVLLTVLTLTIYLSMTPRVGRVLLTKWQGHPVGLDGVVDAVLSLVAVVVSAILLGNGWHALGVPWSLIGLLYLTTFTSLVAFVIDNSTPQQWPEGVPYPADGVPFPS